MNCKTTDRLLTTVQEFINTNPNEVASLASSAVLFKTLVEVSAPHVYWELLNVLTTTQDFVDANPNAAGSLAGNPRLMEALVGDLCPILASVAS